MFIQYPDGIAPIQVVCNSPMEALFSNVDSAVARSLPELSVQEEKHVPAIIAGGGPSLAEMLDRIREIKADGGVIFALNNVARYLHERGIRADYQIVLDARKENADFVRGDYADHCFLASQCHPDVYDACAMPITVWHPIVEGIEEHLPHKPTLIGGGITVGLSAMCVAYTLGYRVMHLFGYDSSYKEDDSHAYEQAMNKNQQTLRVAVDGRVFKASVAMAAQAQKFPHLAVELAEMGCEIYPHGDGLLQHVVKTMQKQSIETAMTAVYDLASSPPTYDFLSFLAEAEKARVDGNFTYLDVVFQPGPMGGFRDDNLPPAVEAREAMLHRICASACRLLPSVRNVEVLKSRRAVAGDVFPKEWREDFPVSHYGTRYFKDSARPLTATPSAKNLVARRFQSPYATITLRQSSYWTTRNSSLPAWISAALFLVERGILPVFVPDYEGEDIEGFENCREASIDIDVRLALYEGAVLNLGVSNGPMALCYLSQAPYMVFKLVDGNTPATSKEFLEAHGISEGGSFGENGTLVWKDDTEEVLLSEIGKWLDMNHFMEKKSACI